MARHLTKEAFYNISWPQCSDDDNNRDASVCCVDCDQFFCKSFLKGHNGVPGANQHQTVQKAGFRHELQTNAHSSYIHGLPRRSRCGAHGWYGYRRRYELPIGESPRLGDAPVISISIHEVKKGLSEYIRGLSSLKQDRLDHKARLQNEKETSLTQCDERMNAIVKYARILGTAFRKDIMYRYEKFTDKLNDDLKFCDRSIAKLESIYKRLQTPVDTNASPTFVDLKQAKVLMEDTKVKMEKCKSKRIGFMKITFKAGNDVEGVVSDSMFGRLYICHETPIVGTSECYTDLHVTDLCSLPDGTIIITDYVNKQLNSLPYDSDTYQVSDYLPLSGSPWGVCSLGGYTVAVTVPDQLRILIVTVGRRMGIKWTFKVDHKCYGIAYTDSRLYISHYNEPQLSVYDIEGKLLQTISEDHNGASLFVRPQLLCVLPSHGHIAVADRGKGVVVIDMSGNLVTRYTYPNMKHTNGVCVDGRGTMYIADSGSKDIVVLGVDNSVTSLSLRLPANPLLVTYDAHSNKLIVTVQGNDLIHTCSLDY